MGETACFGIICFILRSSAILYVRKQFGFLEMQCCNAAARAWFF